MAKNLMSCEVRFMGMLDGRGFACERGLVPASLKDNYQLLNILFIFNLFLFMT